MGDLRKRWPKAREEGEELFLYGTGGRCCSRGAGLGVLSTVVGGVLLTCGCAIKICEEEFQSTGNGVDVSRLG